MTSTLVLSLIAVLVGIEIISIVIFKRTRSRHRQILNRYLGDQLLDSLSESERERVLRAAAAEYNRTIHRKIDLLIIAFHLPALASWDGITRQSRTPPLYYFLVTMGFWFALLFGAIKCVGILLSR